jgi:hypothetical protein
VWEKAQDDHRQVGLPRALDHPFQQILMAEMNAIEGADGERAFF